MISRVVCGVVLSALVASSVPRIALALYQPSKPAAKAIKRKPVKPVAAPAKPWNYDKVLLDELFKHAAKR